MGTREPPSILTSGLKFETSLIFGVAWNPACTCIFTHARSFKHETLRPKPTYVLIYPYIRIDYTEKLGGGAFIAGIPIRGAVIRLETYEQCQASFCVLIEIEKTARCGVLTVVMQDLCCGAFIAIWVCGWTGVRGLGCR